MLRAVVASGGVVVEGFEGTVAVAVSVGGKYSLVYQNLGSAMLCVRIIGRSLRRNTAC